MSEKSKKIMVAYGELFIVLLPHSKVEGRKAKNSENEPERGMNSIYDECISVITKHSHDND